MKCLLIMCGVTTIDRKTEEVRRRPGVREKTSDSLDQDILKWLGHVKRMCGERFTERLYRSEPKVVEIGLS